MKKDIYVTRREVLDAGERHTDFWGIGQFYRTRGSDHEYGRGKVMCRRIGSPGMFSPTITSTQREPIFSFLGEAKSLCIITARAVS